MTILRTEFELLHGHSDMIEGLLADIYLRWTKILSPRFTQYVQVAPLDRLSLGELTAVTKIRFFPLIGIGRTVYLSEGRDATGQRRSIPVAYAVYEV